MECGTGCSPVGTEATESSEISALSESTRLYSLSRSVREAMDSLVFQPVEVPVTRLKLKGIINRGVRTYSLLSSISFSRYSLYLIASSLVGNDLIVVQSELING